LTLFRVGIFQRRWIRAQCGLLLREVEKADVEHWVMRLFSDGDAGGAGSRRHRAGFRAKGLVLGREVIGGERLRHGVGLVVRTAVSVDL
jgi:hypothetical protein